MKSPRHQLCMVSGKALTEFALPHKLCPFYGDERHSNWGYLGVSTRIHSQRCREISEEEKILLGLDEKSKILPYTPLGPLNFANSKGVGFCNSIFVLFFIFRHLFFLSPRCGKNLL